MNAKAITFISAALIIFAIAYLGLIANQGSITQGVDTIGNAVGNSIDNAAEEQEWRNIEWQDLNGTVVNFWVNNQRIYPNKHAKETHDVDAELSTNCYNDHGTFMTLANKNGDWYFPCREEDGAVRLTVWKRESTTSNRFHMQSAYTPKDGNWARILEWLRNTHKATKASVPEDIVLVIDGVAP